MKKLDHRGGAIVELALLVPWIGLLVITVANVGMLAMRKFALDRVCFETARLLALTDLGSVDELRARAESILTATNSRAVVAGIALHDVSVKPMMPYRDARPLQVLELTLNQSVPPFEFAACAWESRIQP